MKTIYLLLALVFSTALTNGQGVAISQLPPITDSLQQGDVLPAVHNGTTRKVTIQQIINKVTGLPTTAVNNLSVGGTITTSGAVIHRGLPNFTDSGLTLLGITPGGIVSYSCGFTCADTSNGNLASLHRLDSITALIPVNAGQILYGDGLRTTSDAGFTWDSTNQNFVASGPDATFKVLNANGKIKSLVQNEFQISSSSNGGYENPMFDIYTTGTSNFNGTMVSVNDYDSTVWIAAPAGNVQLGNNFFYNNLEKSLWVDSLTNMNIHGTDDSGHAWEIHQGDSVMGGPNPYVHVGYGTPNDSMIGFTVQNSTSDFGYKNNVTNNAWHIKCSKQEHKLLLETDIDATHRGWAEWQSSGFWFTFFPSAGEYSYMVHLENPIAGSVLTMNSTDDTASWTIPVVTPQMLTTLYPKLAQYASDADAGAGSPPLTTGMPYINSVTFALTFKQ